MDSKPLFAIRLFNFVIDPDKNLPFVKYIFLKKREFYHRNK